MLPHLEEEEWKLLRTMKRRSQEEQTRWTDLQRIRKNLIRNDKRQNMSEEKREQRNMEKAEARANATANVKLADAHRKKTRRDEAKKRGEEALPDGFLHPKNLPPNRPPLTLLHLENQARQTVGTDHRPGLDLGGGRGDDTVNLRDFSSVCNISSTSSSSLRSWCPCSPSRRHSTSSPQPPLWSSSSRPS